MEHATKIFKDVFGDASAEYRDLIEHLARSYHHGSPDQWRRHAEAIRASLGKDAAGNFDVKTSSSDGMEHLESTQRVENAALLHQVSVLQVQTEAVDRPAGAGAGPLPILDAVHGQANADFGAAMASHLAAHEVKAANKAAFSSLPKHGEFCQRLQSAQHQHRQQCKAPAPPPVAPPPAPPVAPPPAPAPPAPAVSKAAAPSPPVASPAMAAEPVTSTVAKVVSAGWGDGNIADFFLNGRKIDIRGEAGRRGLNVVTIDPDTQQVMSRKTYDVWADPQTENTRLAADINSMPDGRVILVACKDSGMENLDARAISALWSAGASVPGGKEREGYALIGIKGSEALAEQQGGRVEIEGQLPFFVRHPPPLPPSSPSPPPMPAAAQPQQFSPPTWAKEPAAPKPPSTFPTAPPTSEPAQKVRVPKLQVDPQGGVTYQDETVERDGKPEEQGQSWQEVVLMLDKLQAKIKAKRLAGA
ncbi:Dnajb7 [Symbiodinium sp. CCMP2592]|nr:Dnajb7 [Symbiodinium sp. CCMP2592]